MRLGQNRLLGLFRPPLGIPSHTWGVLLSSILISLAIPFFRRLRAYVDNAPAQPAVSDTDVSKEPHVAEIEKPRAISVEKPLVPITERIMVIRTLALMTEGLHSTELPIAIAPEYQNDETTQWRRDYRAFRKGRPHGATNDGTRSALTLKARAKQVKKAKTMRKSLSRSIFALVEEEKVNDVFLGGNSSKELILENMLDVVNQWRLDYRRHRQGAPKGAKNELSNLVSNLSMAHIRLLPTSQAAQLRSAISVHGGKLATDRVAGSTHIHFGAGRLGLGLIIPAIIDSSVPFAVVQRPSSAFKAVLSSDSAFIDFKVRGQVVTRLRVIRSEAELPTKWSGGLLVLTDDASIIQRLCSDAASLSTSLGTAGLEGFSRALSSFRSKDGKKVPLFAGENDHVAVDAMAEELKDSVECVNCMVDRICTSRTITADSLEVDAEPFNGTIVALCPPEHVASPPFSGGNGRDVLVPRIHIEADYLCRRKLVNVNGMHTTLAFMTLVKHEDPMLMAPLKHDKLTSPASDHSLLTLANSNAEEKKAIWHWAVARILLLLFEYDHGVMKHVHNLSSDLELVTELLKYAKKTLNRFSTAKDTTGRILGGGVTARFHGRLQPVNDFLEVNDHLDSMSNLLLKEAGVSHDDMRVTVRSLTEEASRFIGLSPGSTYSTKS